MLVTSLALLFGALVAPAIADGGDDPLTPHSIYAYGINATFIGYGARLTSLYVHDRDNTPRDVVVGYDDPAQYVKDTATNHTYFGAIVGRYANRIKNGTFTIDGQSYQIPENENGGHDTLHGGTVGYDARNWTVTQSDTSSVTFGLYDPDGDQGFPGAVMNYVTYTLSASPTRLTARIVSISLEQATPIMPSTHIYWNLGAFSTPTVLNDTLSMPYAERIIDIDSIEVPTGGLASVKYPSQSPSLPLNFTAPKQIWEGALSSQQCGYGCTGIDNAFILDRPVWSGPDSADLTMLQMSSPSTGIRMTMRTNGQSLQIYSCVGQNGTIPIKASQMGSGVQSVEKYGCLVIEPQQWIDGINHPEWGQLGRQIFSPATGPNDNWAEYTFDTV
ncbi:hypothetical protein JCM24511_09197 [Saitozyma sp. JCM 24511]|nr:hypothetical protein JCM24511_09197 [Saitozyma sp. JCM 24511]